MRTDLLRRISSLAGFLPLLLVTVWAYLPAAPHNYPTVRELLLDPYAGPGQPTELSAMYLRLAVLLASALLCLWILPRAARTAAGAVTAGALASMILVLPGWVPYVMQGGVSAQLALTAACIVIGLLGGAVLLRQLPAAAAPVTALCLLAGTGLAVRTSAEVVLRSQPPLFVLADAVRNPDSGGSQLAAGLHLYAIGGVDEAMPLLRSAGEALLRRYQPTDDEAVKRAARRLAALDVSAENAARGTQSARTGELPKP